MSDRVTRILPLGFAAAAMLAVVGLLIVPSAMVLGGEEENKPGAKAPKEPADNSFCAVCHLNWEKEKFVETHRLKGVGCIDCHGDSDAHMDDEEAHAPPDIMFAGHEVNATCLVACHTRDKLAEVKEHKPEFAKGKKEKVCTECHGEHRLKERTRRWDTKTGKLLEADGRPVE